MSVQVGARHRFGEIALAAFDGDVLIDCQRHRVQKRNTDRLRRIIMRFAADYAGEVVTDTSIEHLGWKALVRCKTQTRQKVADAVLDRCPALRQFVPTSPLTGKAWIFDGQVE